MSIIPVDIPTDRAAGAMVDKISIALISLLNQAESMQQLDAMS